MLILEAMVMPMGIRMMKVTSKNTGTDRIKPARLRPQIARFSGKAATSLSAMTEAAPLSLIRYQCEPIVSHPVCIEPEGSR